MLRVKGQFSINLSPLIEAFSINFSINFPSFSGNFSVTFDTITFKIKSSVWTMGVIRLVLKKCVLPFTLKYN